MEDELHEKDTYLFVISAVTDKRDSRRGRPHGFFTGTVQGFGGEVSAEVTLEDGVITTITALGDLETPGIGSRAIEKLPPLMVEANSVEVDGISGATFSSNAVKAAVQDALNEAFDIDTENQ